MAALDDEPGPGKEPTITAEAKTWVVSLACRKAKELGLSARAVDDAASGRHAREHGPAEGTCVPDKLAQGTVCKILDEQEVKPHKVRYYLERRDPEFKAKMAEVLCVYREVKVMKKAAAVSKKKPSDAVAIISYDEKPGIQAIATTAPDLPPEPGVHATFARDMNISATARSACWPGSTSLTGKVHALVKDRHRSREFIDFLKLLDAAYPAHTAIKLILDNHSAHISKETKTWLAAQTRGPLRIHLHAQARLLAQPCRGLLLQARPLRPAPHPRRIQTGTQGSHHRCNGRVQRKPVVHTWSYKLEKAA